MKNMPLSQGTRMQGPVPLACLLVLASVVGWAHAGVVRICLPTSLDETAAASCSSLLNQFGATADTTYQCIPGTNAAGCIAMVKAGDAELTKFGGEGMFNASTDAGLVPFVAEVNSNTPGASYYAVAVTRKETCDAKGASINLESFKGSNVCMTGYRRSAGWVIPMGYMISNKLMPVVDADPNIEQDAETVASYFGNICAAGTNGAGPARGGANWQPLCTACAGDCGNSLASEPYVDYEGALRCLMESKGEVAFTKHTIPLEFASDGTLPAGTTPREWSTVPLSGLRLVCPGGGCKEISQWSECNIAAAPSHAFMGKPGFEATPDGAAAITFLSGANASLIAASRGLSTSNSQVLFTTSASSTTKIANPNDFAAHFGATALQSYRTIRTLQVPTVRICTQSDAEQEFCGRATAIMNARPLGATFACVQKASAGECLTAIKNGEADMRAYDGLEIYNGLQNNLKAIVAEDYGMGNAAGTDYYSVAVVRKEWCDSTNDGNPTFRDLQGKRMCSTGYRRSAGWVMPTGFLVSAGIMPVQRSEANIEDDAESVAAFFSGGVCAARTFDNGPANSADQKGARWDPMCKLCKGDCSNSIEREPFYDYTGALRCLMEGAADVAFTKHTVVQDYAKDGSTPAPWSALNQADMRLLCPRGGCVPVTQPFQCHVATSAAHAVLVRTDYPHTDALKSALVTVSKDNEFRGLVFNKEANAANHLFKSSTYQLVPIDDDTRAYLGTALAAFQGFDALNDGRSPNGLAIVPSTSSSESGGDDGLSGGAIAGIAIGCVVGGALLAVAGVMLYNRRKARQMDELTTTLSGSGGSTKVDIKANGY